ncbi:MAG: hypothetical protein ACRDVE_21945, partial [Actinocrinis sp.]
MSSPETNDADSTDAGTNDAGTNDAATSADRGTAHGAAVTVRALLARSNRLGADPRNTNYAGGNTSAKGAALDPVTGADAEIL